jgi:hypothetical protein
MHPHSRVILGYVQKPKRRHLYSIGNGCRFRQEVGTSFSGEKTRDKERKQPFCRLFDAPEEECIMTMSGTKRAKYRNCVDKMQGNSIT